MTDICPQTLIHVLNACDAAMELRRYNYRHDIVLAELYNTILEYLPEGTRAIADLSAEYFSQT